MRGATPGSLLILAATILLTLVTCSVPIIKSIEFLTATVGGTGSEAGATIKFGALGYCIDSTCKGPTIGYSFDPTQLLGVATSVDGISIDSSKYSTAVIKALTYTLVLHPIALVACALTLLTGILAHCGDLSLKCLNSVFSSLASMVTLVAVGCDFALFIIAKKRINDVSNASASLGIALWLTLVSWILIVLSSFFFCCGSTGRGSGGRKKNNQRDEYDDDAWKSGANGQKGNGYSDQMRMDALDAESQRKLRKKDLPEFAVYESEHAESTPLKRDYEDQMRAGAAGFAANGAHSQGGYGYDNQHTYADGGYNDYTPNSEHAPTGYAGYPNAGGMGNPMESYIPGVGPGAQRGVTPATAYYDGSQYEHPQASLSTHDGPSQYPGYNDDASYGAHRAPSWSSHLSRGQSGDAFDMQNAPPVPAIPSNMQSQGQRQASQDYNYGQDHYESQQGHSMDYSGATFGGGSGSPSPYDAVNQATAAAQRSRALPNAPGVGRQESLLYSPTSPHSASQASQSRAGPGDDGFGLSVLQAGAAAAAVGGSSSNRQGGERSMSPMAYEDSYASSAPSARPLPNAPAANRDQQDDGRYTNSRGNTSEPPGYESDHEVDAYGGIDHGYPQEKR